MRASLRILAILLIQKNRAKIFFSHERLSQNSGIINLLIHKKQIRIDLSTKNHHKPLNFWGLFVGGVTVINYTPFLRVPQPLQRPIWLNGMHMTYYLSNNQTAHQILCKSVFNCLRYPPPRRGENVKLLGRGNTLFCHLLSLQYHPRDRKSTRLNSSH